MRLGELAAMSAPEGFRPFSIITKGGLRMEVPHPEFVSIPPDETASFFGVYTTARPTILRLIDLDAIDHRIESYPVNIPRFLDPFDCPVRDRRIGFQPMMN